MIRVSRILACVGLLVLVGWAVRMKAAASSTSDVKEIEAFNQKFQEVTLQMNNAALMALWADDGVTMLPGMSAIAGKKTIAKWLDDLMVNLAGYKVTKQENEFHDIEVAGDWASEWGTTYQVVQPPDNKPVIESYGKILLVLHKEKDGWKIKREMWNAAPKP